MVVKQVPSITALGPNDPDDGEEGRKQRGLAIAALVPIKRNRLGYQIPSQSDNGFLCGELGRTTRSALAQTLRNGRNPASTSTRLLTPSSGKPTERV